MLKTMFLTKAFYKAHANCHEIERKETRPYIRIQVMVNGVLWGIPLRSHISHEYVLWTDKDNNCGIDFTKAVVITDPARYISATQPHIRSDEFKVLKKIDEHRVVQKLNQYIKAYKKAKERPEIPHNKQLLQYSTLQYFEKYI